MLLTRMFSESPGTPGPQAADAADDEVDLHAGLRGLVELLDDLLVDQGVELGPDLRLAAGPGVRHLLLDQPHQRLAQIDRGQRQPLQPRRLGIAGHVVERLGGIAAQRRVAGEEREVGVDPGGDRVVVAGAEMAVGAQAPALAAHDHRDLGVGLER